MDLKSRVGYSQVDLFNELKNNFQKGKKQITQNEGRTFQKVETIISKNLNI